MGTPEYRFVETWKVGVPVPVVYEVLADLSAYPQWWPQVRSVERIDDNSAHVVCRSLLPYSLRFVMFRARDDRSAGILEARLRGDLDGWARWTVRPGERSALLLYEQQVTTPGPLLQSLARLGRPLLEFNHAWMMRAGRRGLERRLGGAAGVPAAARG